MSITLNINDRITTRKVDFFNAFKMKFQFNAIASTFSFKFYFNPFVSELKEMACVGHYHECLIKGNDQQLLKGVMTSQGFSTGPTSELKTFGGYSMPGVLEDCTIPPDLYPLQSDGMSIKQIAEKLIAPFHKHYGLEMVIDPAVEDRMNKVVKKSTASETQKIKDYLQSLCVARNIIMSHDEYGRLLFTEAKTTADPIMHFDDSEDSNEMFRCTSLSLDFDGQSMHSHITVQKQANPDGGNAGEETIRNPLVIGSVYRPIVISQSSGDDNDTISAARRALGNELRSGLKLKITTDRWEYEKGKRIMPNMIVSVYSPNNFLYYKTNFFIESVEYEHDNVQEVATLNCVLPACYDGSDVENPFRDINLH